MKAVNLKSESLLAGRYFVVGIWNMIFGVSVFALVYLILGSDDSYLLVGIIAHPIGVTQSHFMQRKLVWQSHEKYLPELMRFALVQTQGFFAIILLMGLLINVIGVSVIMSQAISTVTVTGVSFLLMRYWTFKGTRA